ncbi:hypothetical protein HZS_3472 [Henneguya salminicola]|nr:hypothetical protein HZS_3472 [Henneguya salminicola]
MNTTRLISAISLIKDVETNMQSMAGAIKSLHILFKNLTKIFRTIFCDCVNDSISSMFKSVNSTHTRFNQLAQSIKDLEYFYNNKMANFKVLNLEYLKKTRKKIKEFLPVRRRKKIYRHNSPLLVDEKLKTDVYAYARCILNIELSIYHKMFECFKCYQFDFVGDCRQNIEKHNEMYSNILLANDTQSISGDGFLDLIENFNKNIPTASTLRAEEAKTYFFDENSISNFDREESKITYIAWQAYEPSREGCIGLLPGQTLIPYSEEINGWRYGQNISTKQLGWFPVSFIKSESQFYHHINNLRKKIQA